MNMAIGRLRPLALPVVAALLDPATQWVNAQRVEASGGMFV